jgi:hypothetical protein
VRAWSRLIFDPAGSAPDTIASRNWATNWLAMVFFPSSTKDTGAGPLSGVLGAGCDGIDFPRAGRFIEASYDKRLFVSIDLANSRIVSGLRR